MKMHFLSGGRLIMKRSVYIPDAAADEKIELPVLCALLRHPQGNVLFDTGCHPLAATDPEARWGGLARFMKLISPPEDNLVNGLAGLGIGPSDIDLVVNSHFHTDHCGCNEYFRNATILCSNKELAAANAEDAVRAGYLPTEWKHGKRFDSFDGQRDVFGDGRIVLVPVPGHTPGCIAALVGLDRSGSFLIASDSVAIRDCLDRDYNPKPTWNHDIAMGSLAEIRRIQAAGTEIIFGHDAAQWDALKKGAEFYD